MRKQIVIALFAIALLGMAGVTQAKDSRRGHNSNHSRGHSSGHHQPRHYRNQFRHGKHYYGGAYRHHGYRPYNYGHHGYGYRGYSNGLGYVAGALVVGSLIHSLNHRQPSQIVYRSNPVSTTQDYWYRVDSDGQCVEIRLNRDRQEVWTYVDSSYCR